MEPETAVKRQTALEFGAEQSPRFAVTGSLTITIEQGSVIYCIKPIGQDVTITSAKDANGAAISALAGAVIQQGDEYVITLSEVVFTAISANNNVTCYVKNNTV